MNSDIQRFFLKLAGTTDVRVHIIKNENAEMSLRQSTSGDAVYLMKVRTKPNHRGKGYATELLSRACETADDFGVTLFLEVEPQDDSDLSQDELAEWYWRHGFRGCIKEMVRVPTSH